MPPPVVSPPSRDSFEAKLAAALDSGASVFGFTLGVLPKAAIGAIKGRGMFLIGAATTVAE